MPTLSEIQNTVLRCLKNGNIAMTTPDDITIGIIPMDYTACDVLSCIEHHALNCNENEICHKSFDIFQQFFSCCICPFPFSSHIFWFS